MKKNTRKIALILAILGSVVTILIKWQLTTGWLVGCLLAFVLYKRNESYWTDILDEGTVKGSKYGFHFAINYALMAIPMIIAALYPKYMNIFSVALGLMLVKLSVYTEEVIKVLGRKMGHENSI